jgi:hypothetical protein
LYFEEVLKEIRHLYKLNQFASLSKKVEKLRYAYNLLVLDYFKAELLNNPSSNPPSRGTVIDVTDS